MAEVVSQLSGLKKRRRQVSCPHGFKNYQLRSRGLSVGDSERSPLPSTRRRRPTACDKTETATLLAARRTGPKSLKRKRDEFSPRSVATVTLKHGDRGPEEYGPQIDPGLEKSPDSIQSPGSPQCGVLETLESHQDPVHHLEKTASPVFGRKFRIDAETRCNFLSALQYAGDCQTDTSSLDDYDERACSSMGSPLSSTEQESSSTFAEASQERQDFDHLRVAYIHEREILSETSWLTGTLINLVFYKFALQYPGVIFLPVEFTALHLPSASRNMKLCRQFYVTDILGRQLDYSSQKAIVFAVNFGNRHWNLIRIQQTPKAELQLFEPMGRPAARSKNGHVSLRYIPQCVIEWLDICWPRNDGSWLRRSVSAITKRHQLTAYDCGVACLLYAEKCGQGQEREEINEWTDQIDITSMRQQLQNHISTYIQAS